MIALLVAAISACASFRESTVELNDYLAYEPVRQSDGVVRPRLLPSDKVAVFRKMPAFDLENDSLRLTVVPELGGRIWRAYDKRVGRDLVYFNNAAKTTDDALPGVVCAGGIAFDAGCNQPLQPIGGACQENADGSVSCWLRPADSGSWRAEVRLANAGVRFSLRLEIGDSVCPERQPTVTAFFPAREMPSFDETARKDAWGVWWRRGEYGVVVRESDCRPVKRLVCEVGQVPCYTDYDGPFVACRSFSRMIEWQGVTNRAEMVGFMKRKEGEE